MAASHRLLTCATGAGVALALMTRCLAAPQSDIVIQSYRDGETVRYPLVLLRGDLADAALTRVDVVNESSKRTSRAMEGAALKGRFKVLAELVPGDNNLVVKAGKAAQHLTLRYKPATSPYMVRAVHFTDRTGDPTYDTQFANDPQDYRARWDAALKLLQTFTAEEMNRNGHGRKTFNLELDEQGHVVVHIVKGKGTFEEMQKMGGGEAYDAAATGIAEQLPKGPFKNLVCVAFSRHQKGTGRATAYAALGGGDVALMGGACFYTWPLGVTNILATFVSDVQIDKENFHADDVGRFAVWATAATTMGAGLHEIGHAFTLPHTQRHHNGIMLRGSDTLNRYITFLDPPCSGHTDFRPFAEDSLPYWSDVSAAALAASRWMEADARPYTETNTIRFAIDPKTAELVVASDDGLAFLCVEIPGAADRFDKRAGTPPLPRELRTPMADIAKQFGTSRLTVRAMDGMGHYRHAGLAELLNMEANLTTGKPATASSGSGENGPGAAVDGSLDTYWDGNPYPQWLQVDLGREATLDEVHLYGYADGGRYYQYRIELSRDGKEWATVVDASANTAKSTEEGYRHTFAPTAARYVRVTMLKNSANPGVHIRELRVFEPGKPRSQPLCGEVKAMFEAECAKRPK